MSVKKINNQNLESVINQEKPVLLDFYAEWCGPCRMLSPIIDEIAEEKQDVIVGKINVGENADLANEFGVYSVPTLVVIKDGKIINASVGVRPKNQILSMLQG